MPALSNRKKAAKSKKRADQGGFLCDSTHESTAHEREDWDMNALNMDALMQLSEQSEARIEDQKSINDVLGKDASQTGQKRKGLYQRNSDVTKWRRRKEAESVDSKQKLTSFGITVTKKSEPESFVILSHTKVELLKIKECAQNLDQYIRPIMNKALEGSSLYSYDFCRYLSVKLYFSKRLQGMNKGIVQRKLQSTTGPITTRNIGQQPSSNGLLSLLRKD